MVKSSLDELSLDLKKLNALLTTGDTLMLGLRKKAVPITAVPLTPTLTRLEKPLPTTITVGTEPLGTYEALAKELGFLPAQLLKEQLFRFLKGNDIPIYNYDDVYRYMVELAEREGKVWYWRALRKCDTIEDRSWGGRMPSDRVEKAKDVGAYRGHGSYHSGEPQYRPYDKAVPIHILRHVKQIVDEFGDNLHFYVSDYSVPVPDPFIMVTGVDIPFTVFGVWDEPGFSTNV